MSSLLTLKKDKKPTVLDKLKKLDYILIAAVLALSAIGVLAVGSADSSLQVKQMLGVAGSIVIMIVLALLVDYKKIIKLWIPMYIVMVILLVFVIVRGHDSHGASRWIAIGPLTFQPSELAKIILILFYAQFIMKYRERIKATLLIPLCIIFLIPPLILVVSQPDLSTTIMLVVIFSAIMFVSGLDRRVVAGILILLIPTVILVIYSASTMETGAHPFLRDYQQVRIKAWLHPEDYRTDSAMQTLNSLMAIGSGGFWGKGINNNEITSVLNSGYISESETDLIFTVIGEEMGFVGGALVIFLLLLISLRCLRIARKTGSFSGRLIASAMAVWIGIQGFMNIAVATGTIPNTGIPLPFVSSGLSALICTFAGVGFVLNIGSQTVRRF